MAWKALNGVPRSPDGEVGRIHDDAVGGRQANGQFLPLTLPEALHRCPPLRRLSRDFDRSGACFEAKVQRISRVRRATSVLSVELRGRLIINDL